MLEPHATQFPNALLFHCLSHIVVVRHQFKMLTTTRDKRFFILFSPRFAAAADVRTLRRAGRRFFSANSLQASGVGGEPAAAVAAVAIQEPPAFRQQ